MKVEQLRVRFLQTELGTERGVLHADRVRDMCVLVVCCTRTRWATGGALPAQRVRIRASSGGQSTSKQGVEQAYCTQAGGEHPPVAEGVAEGAAEHRQGWATGVCNLGYKQEVCCTIYLAWQGHNLLQLLPPLTLQLVQLLLCIQLCSSSREEGHKYSEWTWIALSSLFSAFSSAAVHERKGTSTVSGRHPCTSTS